MFGLIRVRQSVLGGASLACLSLLAGQPAAAAESAQVSEVVVTAKTYVAPTYVVPNADWGRETS